MTQQKATNVQWHHGEVTRDDRFQLMGQRGTTLWFTGLSGSGKSTVAVALPAGWRQCPTGHQQESRLQRGGPHRKYSPHW
jgi:ABC-type dipeptide/oligopeptide/nickel transport system ATPase subunit